MSSKERANLKAMLNFWMEHNTEHAGEFKEWAEKAKAFGENEVCEQILKAAKELNRVNESLSRALDKLG